RRGGGDGGLRRAQARSKSSDHGYDDAVYGRPRDDPRAAQTRSEAEDYRDQRAEGRRQDFGRRANGREILSHEAVYGREAVESGGRSAERGMICGTSTGSAALDERRSRDSLQGGPKNGLDTPLRSLLTFRFR